MAEEPGFAAWLATLPARGDIALAAPAGLGIVGVAAGRDGTAVERLTEVIGAAPPVAPGCVVGGDVTVVATGPGTWLAVREAAPAAWADEVAAALGGAAAVFDQSSGYAVLRLEGEGAARLLQKGVNIDLDDAAFPPGAAAVSLAAHIGVVLWRLAPARFEVAVFRSLAASFAHWLEEAAAPAGLRLHSRPPEDPA